MSNERERERERDRESNRQESGSEEGKRIKEERERERERERGKGSGKVGEVGREGVEMERGSREGIEGIVSAPTYGRQNLVAIQLQSPQFSQSIKFIAELSNFVVCQVEDSNLHEVFNIFNDRDLGLCTEQSQ